MSLSFPEGVAGWWGDGEGEGEVEVEVEVVGVSHVRTGLRGFLHVSKRVSV